MIKYKVILLFVFSLLLAACVNKGGKGNGNADIVYDSPIPGDSITVITDVRSVGDFNEILLYDASTVNIVLGRECRVQISGPKNYVQHYNTKVTDGELTLQYADHDSGHRKVHVTIYAPSLKDIDIRGSHLFSITGSGYTVDDMDLDLAHINKADIFTVQKNVSLRCNELDLDLREVGLASAAVDVSELDIKTRHVQRLEVSGKTGQLETQKDDVSNVDLSRLQHSSN